MTDIFKVIADPQARKLMETLAKHPASTEARLVSASSLTAEQVTKHLSMLAEVKLVKATGSGGSKKYSLNPKGFGPYVSWLAGVAEAQTVANLELQLVDLGERLGNAVADGSSWISKKVSENVSFDVDPKQWGKELGKILADVKRELQKEAKEVQKEAKNLVNEVKTRVKK